MSRYVPPAVLINHQLEILQTRGHTASFLELPAGKASLNLLKMARPGLLFELRSAIEEAREKGFEAIRQDVRAEEDGKSRTVSIRVIPFKVSTQEQYSFLIIFEGSSSAENRSVPAPGTPSMPASSLLLDPTMTEEQSVLGRQIIRLGQELAATREYLQSIIESQEGTNEELQSANEEIQSGNEELQSTNEELQTSKEELESANEELHTVNEEMQHRNELLTTLNNDLTNLLYSVNLPIVMLSADLSVRRFTPQAAAALGLTANDIGRPMPRLRLKIDMGDLEQNLLDVIQQVQSKQFSVQDNDGKWCIMRIVPYRTMDNRIDGVVLSVVTELGLPSGQLDGTDGRKAISAPATPQEGPEQRLLEDRGVSDVSRPALVTAFFLRPGNPPPIQALYIIMLQQRRLAMKEIGPVTPPRDPPGDERTLRLETALRRSEKLAMAGRLAASVMHEINNPSQAIADLVYLIGKEADHPELVRARAVQIEEQLVRIQYIARQTLSFFRDTPQLQAKDLVPLVDTALRYHSALLEEKRIQVRKEMPDMLIGSVYPGDFLQLVSNLVRNSAEALPVGGMLCLRLRASRHQRPSDRGRQRARHPAAHTGEAV